VSEPKLKTLVDQFFGDATKEAPDTTLCGVTLTRQMLLDLLDMFNHQGYSVFASLLKAVQQHSIDGTLGSYAQKEVWKVERDAGRYLLAEELLDLPADVGQMLTACTQNEQSVAK
jgi:hypothetical protein